MRIISADLPGLPRRLLRRAELAFYRIPPVIAGLPARRAGQTTIEYLLLLAIVAGVAAMMAVLFHRRILGGIFTIVGMIIGAGQPK
ncbi:MAG: hypothetical protein M0025_05095 [Elusimicrobia bacterium]|nr:hypothetical protein [Elusimicrobiota bacterium]MDA8243478.1 hypothetical protein [Elusimicrobiota bacterium]